MESKYNREEAFKLLGREGKDLEELYLRADSIRREYLGDEVFIRSIIEFSNICVNNCLYCGIRSSNQNISRYTMSSKEIIDIAASISDTVQTTVVLQAGEISGIDDKELGNIIRAIKDRANLSVTLSAGNRPYDIYRYWHDCGMDRYLLRFETSDPVLFRKIHPGSTLEDRIACLKSLEDIGVQTGSGFMIGIPGEIPETLADNILLCRELDLDMIGIGPFIPHPATPFGSKKNIYEKNPEMFYKALAVLRIFNPQAHIPATTAFDALFPGIGRDLALQRGANIFMPNITPVKYKKEYFLYPGKPYVDESPEECLDAAIVRIERLGRIIGKGPGHSIKKKHQSGRV